MFINKIHVPKKRKEYIKKRWLEAQFNKAVKYIFERNYKAVDFRKRQPKSAGIHYFKINNQFRAKCRIMDDVLIVFEIDNHQ